MSVEHDQPDQLGRIHKQTVVFRDRVLFLEPGHTRPAGPENLTKTQKAPLEISRPGASLGRCGDPWWMPQRRVYRGGSNAVMWRFQPVRTYAMIVLQRGFPP